MSKKRGRIYEKSAMIMRQNVGTMKEDESGLEYELTAGYPALVPLVKSMKTGKTFELSWQDIVEMAVERGVDEE